MGGGHASTGRRSRPVGVTLQRGFDGSAAPTNVRANRPAMASRLSPAGQCTAPGRAKVAVVALANKIARIAYAVLTTGQPYDPTKGALIQA